MGETRLGEGFYYPRIARPYLVGKQNGSGKEKDSAGYNPADQDKLSKRQISPLLAMSGGQLHYLKEHLEMICSVIYPSDKNIGAYGIEIRNVFVAACADIEARWHGMLRANGCPFETDQVGDDIIGMRHYVK
jgi:hypothetical protein